MKRTDAYPYTNDQAVNIAVGRYIYHGITAEQVTDYINGNNTRLTQIRVDNPNIPTFTVIMVTNSGSYRSAWWWYFGVDATRLGNLLNEKRLISLDPYHTSAGLRFAAVMVPNTGVQARGWWWYFGLNAAAVHQRLAQDKRLVSARPYRNSGSSEVVYAVIMIQNLGVDYKGWQWLTGKTIDAIISEINGKMQRVVSFTPNPAGNFDAILVNSEGERWWWWYGIDAATIVDNLVSHHTRLIDITPYTVNGAKRFAVVELDDSNPEQAPINAASITVRDNAEANGWRGGFHGTYAIPFGSASPVVAYNSRFRFEPASSIKALYLLYTLRAGVPLTSTITYYWTDNTSPPNPNACPFVPEIPANAHTVTIRDALIGMIRSSNNVYTRAFAKHWGTAPVEAYAHSIGMTSTFLRQPYIGCGFRGGVRNEVSLADFATLYRAVDSGSALTGAARQFFLDTLVGGPGAGGSSFSAVVTQEAVRTGRFSHASAFMSALDIRWKAGGYGFGMAPAGTSKTDVSIAGLAYIPFKNPNGSIAKRTYFFGDFVNDLVITCPATPPCPASSKAGALLLGNAAEALRTSIRAAFLTWPASFVPEDAEYLVNDETQAVIDNDMIGEMDLMFGGEGIHWVDHACEM